MLLLTELEVHTRKYLLSFKAYGPNAVNSSALANGELSTADDILSSAFHSFTSRTDIYTYRYIVVIVEVTPVQKFKLAQQQHSSKKMSIASK